LVFNVLQTQGAALVHTLLFNMCGVLPSYLLPDLSEVLWYMWLLHPEFVQSVVFSAPVLQQFPNHQVNPRNKETFLEIFNPFECFQPCSYFSFLLADGSGVFCLTRENGADHRFTMNKFLGEIRTFTRCFDRTEDDGDAEE
jgi:hypothetical protein